ncbi:L,D-transpeptidase [Afifella pfennigii]|uniref:L,D-transpeptidase n=1 Tax=Afifella pfennigii TaxID=209897 RepID=UPI00047E0DDD|nr:L,D-transpeptidase [Afifella pfennigii]
MRDHFSRRQFMATSLLAAAALSPIAVLAQTLKPAAELKPGEWSWYPERSESGPVAVIVSLAEQLAFVYRNGIRIGVSTISSGRAGYTTPTGVFTVLRKEKMHYSSKYNNAPMPDSQFFFGGCALHAGGLPGYPSSHGCVHLPRAFADLLFGVTHHGTPVIVTNERSGVGTLRHAGLVLTDSDLKQVEEMVGHVAGKSLPSDEDGDDAHALSMLVSGADRKLIALRNGEIFLESQIGIANPSWPLGTHVYLLHDIDAARTHFNWVAVGLGTGHEDNVAQQRELAATTRLQIPPEVYAALAQNLHPGATMMLTDLPAHPDTRSGTDFVIMRDAPVA